MTLKTYDELAGKILKILPDAILDEDETGELIITTGLRVGIDDMLVSVNEEEEEEE